MKFHQLSMGQRFEFEGEVYVRTKPMIAVHEANGSQRFIRRSATVRALGQDLPAGEPQAATGKDSGIQGEAVLEAFDAFYARCLLGLEELEADVDTGQMERLRGKLRDARGRFMESLSL